MQAVLSDPSVPTQTLEQWFEHVPVSETRMISGTYIGAVRDAWVEQLKIMNAAALTRYSTNLAQSSEHAPHDSDTVFVRHLHDEAPMRFRSWNADLSERRLRGRSSKIQNSCVSISGREGFGMVGGATTYSQEEWGNSCIVYHHRDYVLRP